MEHYIIGIDPGGKGGLAVIDMCDEELKTYTIYDIEKYETAMRIFKKGTLYIEKVHSMPKQGVKSTFAFGENFGILKGLAIAHHLRIVEVLPQTWKKHFRLIGKDKKESIELAKKLFPKIDLNIGKRKVIESDGIAEAALIAKYGLEVENGRKRSV